MSLSSGTGCVCFVWVKQCADSELILDQLSVLHEATKLSNLHANIEWINKLSYQTWPNWDMIHWLHNAQLIPRSRNGSVQAKSLLLDPYIGPQEQIITSEKERMPFGSHFPVLGKSLRPKATHVVSTWCLNESNASHKSFSVFRTKRTAAKWCVSKTKCSKWAIRKN